MSNGRHFNPPTPAYRPSDPFANFKPISAERIPSCETTKPPPSRPRPVRVDNSMREGRDERHGNAWVAPPASMAPGSLEAKPTRPPTDARPAEVRADAQVKPEVKVEAKPVAPVAKPVAEVKPTAAPVVAKPVAEVKPAAPVAKPVAEVKPAAPVAKPVAEVKSAAPAAKPVAEAKPVAPAPVATKPVAEVKPPVKPEVKAEAKPAAKPELKPETKAEARPALVEAKPAAKPVELKPVAKPAARVEPPRPEPVKAKAQPAAPAVEEEDDGPIPGIPDIPEGSMSAAGTRAKPQKRSKPVVAAKAAVEEPAEPESEGGISEEEAANIVLAEGEELRRCEWDRCGKLFAVKVTGRTVVRRFCSGTCRGRASEARTGKRGKGG